METKHSMVNQLGLKFEESVFFEWVQPEIKVFGAKEKYFSWYEKGVSIIIKEKIIDCIFLYFIYPKFKQYKGELPFGLRGDLNNGELVCYLGEPNEKSGGGSSNITMNYKRLGLEIEFHSRVWSLPDAHFSYLALYEHKNKPLDLICAVCKKISTKKCSKCKLVFYCGRECQVKHWKYHKEFCLKGKK